MSSANGSDNSMALTYNIHLLILDGEWMSKWCLLSKKMEKKKKINLPPIKWYFLS